MCFARLFYAFFSILFLFFDYIDYYYSIVCFRPVFIVIVGYLAGMPDLLVLILTFLSPPGIFFLSVSVFLL